MIAAHGFRRKHRDPIQGCCLQPIGARGLHARSVQGESGAAPEEKDGEQLSVEQIEKLQEDFNKLADCLWESGD